MRCIHKTTYLASRRQVNDYYEQYNTQVKYKLPLNVNVAYLLKRKR
jgi:hypothetical protein